MNNKEYLLWLNKQINNPITQSGFYNSTTNQQKDKISSLVNKTNENKLNINFSKMNINSNKPKSENLNESLSKSEFSNPIASLFTSRGMDSSFNIVTGIIKSFVYAGVGRGIQKLFFSKH